MAKDDKKEQQRDLKEYNRLVNRADAKESDGRKLDNEQKKHKSDLDKLVKSRSKLYSVNESKDRQLRDIKMQEYKKFAEKDISSWDPYDNTPSSKKSNVAALGYAAQFQSISLLERILKSQDNNPFNASLLNLHQQQVTLLGVISENLKAMRGVLAPTVKEENKPEYKEYQTGVGDTAKYLASLQFDKAAGSYLKSVGSKLDSTGELGMAIMAIDQFKDLAKNGGLYSLIKDSIQGTIKTAVLGSKNAKEWDKMKEDPAAYIQDMINRAAGSKNAGIRALAEPLFTTNKIDLERKMNKTDWSAGAKFDNKFYKSVIGSFETLREILGAIKGTKTTQFDWDSETYRTESEIYLKQISKNEDKLKNVRTNMKNELASIMQEMGNDPKYAPLVRNNLDVDVNGNIKKDVHGNSKWTSDKIIKYVEKYIQSTGGRFDNMGDDLTNIIKSMGINPADPAQLGIARQAMNILGMLRDYYRSTTYSMKERMNSLSSGYRDLHGRNTYNQIDNRIGSEAIQTLQAMYDQKMNDPEEIKKLMERVNLDVSLPKSGGFGGSGVGSSSFTNRSTFSGYNEAKTYIENLNKNKPLNKVFKTNSEAAKLLQGDRTETPINVAQSYVLDKFNIKDKASELKSVNKLNDHDYDIVMGNKTANSIDTENANKTVEREYKKYEACVKLYEILHRAGATAQAYAAKHGGSPSKYISQGYIGSPTDLMDCVDENGKINQAKMAKLGWGFVSDSYIANEAKKQAEEDRKYKMDGNVVQNTNKLLSTVWQDTTIQKKLRIGGGTATGLAIGSMLKNKGVISSNLGVYTMGAIGAGVMMTERAKKAIDMMYGPDSETKGPNGFSNREIGMAKLAQKIIPAAAGVAVGGKTFMFSQRIFNSMGPVASLVGFIPSLGAALAAGGITYKLLPMLRNKILKAEDGKGIFGKLKNKLKGNKTLANIFGLTGERSNAAIYADNIDPIIKELEVNIAKLRQDNPYSVEANLKEDNLKALKDYQQRLKAIDKDNNMKMEDKNSQASQIYDGIINLIQDQQKELFIKRTSSDIDARNKAKDGINAANETMIDHEAIRAQNNIDQYNTATNTGLSSMSKGNFRSKESYAQEGAEAWAESKYKTSHKTVQEAQATFNSFRGAEGKKNKAKFMEGHKDDYMTNLKKSDPLAIEKSLRTSGLISDKVKFNDDNEFIAWLDENRDKVFDHHIETNNGAMNDYIAAQMDAKFGKELADVFRAGSVDDTLFDRFNASVIKNSVSKDNMDELAKSGKEHETDALRNQAIKTLGYVKPDGTAKDYASLSDDEKSQVDAYVASRYFEQNLQNTSIRLNPKVLQSAMKDNTIFDWMNGKTNSTGIPDIDKFLAEFKHIDGNNSKSINSAAFRQMFGGWLIRQAYMAGLSNTGNLDAKSYNELFENILKEYVTQVNSFKDSHYKKKLDDLTQGNTSITDKYGLSSTVYDIQNIYKSESDPAKRQAIINSMLINEYANNNLTGEDFGDIIGGQYVAGEEFNKLVALRRAIIKNPDGSDIPDDVHKQYIMDKINSFNANGFFGRLMTKFGTRFARKFNGMDEDDVAEEKTADKVLVHALTNMYNTENLSGTPYYKKETVKGSDGVDQYKWVQDGTIGDRAPKFPTTDELRGLITDNFTFNMDKYAFGSGAGYNTDTANANMYASKNSTLKMSDLAGYSFSNGSHLDTFGCSIAAANNALVILKVPTLSKETMINIANRYLDKYGIKYGFFTHIANMLGIKSEIYMANGNKFNKDFFSKLSFNNTTYVVLLDNIGHDSGAHYVNILSVSGDNISINDPMQNGLTDLSISEITARASLIIKYDASNISSKISSIDTTVQNRELNEAGTGSGTLLSKVVNASLMKLAKTYNKRKEANATKEQEKPIESGSSTTIINNYNAPENTEETSSKADYQEGLYDPQVALIATNVSDEKQKQGIISFMSSSKNKAFAAAATRFRGLLSKPEVTAELFEKQNVADTEEQEGKDISEIKDALKDGGTGKLSPEELEALAAANQTEDDKSDKKSLIKSLGGLGGVFKGLKKVWKWGKKKFFKKGASEVAEEGVEQAAKEGAEKAAAEGAESVTKKVTSEAAEQGTKLATKTGQEILETGGSKIAKKTGQEMAEQGGKAASKGMIKGVKTILTYIFKKFPSAVIEKLAGNKFLSGIASIFGKNLSKMLNGTKTFLSEFSEKILKKATDSVIGKAIKTAAKKSISFIGLAMDIGMWYWDYKKALPDAASLLKMENKGVTQNFLEENDLDDNVARAYATYKNGASLVLSVIGTIKQTAEAAATGVAAAATGGAAAAVALPAMLLSATYWAIATVVIQEIFEMSMSFDTFLNTFTSIKKEIQERLDTTNRNIRAIQSQSTNTAKKLQSDIDKDLAERDNSSKTVKKAVAAGSAGSTAAMLKDKGGIDESSTPKPKPVPTRTSGTSSSSSYSRSSRSSSSSFRSSGSSIFERVKNFGDSFKNSTSNLINILGLGVGSIASGIMNGEFSGSTGAGATFDFSKIPSMEQLKGAKFTPNEANNQRAIKFMSMLLPIASEVSKKHGIYVNPFLAMAQWALESKWGTKDSGNYNFWGIKGWGKPNEYWDGSVANVATHEVINGVSKGMDQKFRAYRTPEDGIRDYFLFMNQRFPSIQTMGVEGLNHGVNGGKYATGIGYIPLVSKLYNQFASGMKSSGFDIASLQADISNNARLTPNGMFTDTGVNNPDMANLTYNGSKWQKTPVVGKTNMKWASPLQGLGSTEIASVYGDRSDVAAIAKAKGINMSSWHKGVDFARTSGTPFFSIGDGVVEKAGGGDVNNIIVRHANGIASEYMHGYPTVKVGDRVRAGQQIGKVGKVGTGGAHLHLGMFKGQSVKGIHSNYYDPFLELGLNPKNVRTRNSPENIRFLKSHHFAANSESPEVAKAGKQIDPTGIKTKNGDHDFKDKGGETVATDSVVTNSSSALINEVKGLKILIANLINVVATGMNGSAANTNKLLNAIIEAIKSKEKDDIMSQISTSKFN